MAAFYLGIFIICGLLLIAGIGIVFFRGAVLFPMRAVDHGWGASFSKYKFSVLLAVLILCCEAANFSGFSWTRLTIVSQSEIINSAIKYNYPDIYSGADDLRKDYSSFTPQISYWGNWVGDETHVLNKLLGIKHYEVRLPDAVVVTDVDGNALFSRSCSDNSWCSPLVAPDHPILGIVGTVQYGAPNYEIANDFSVHWTTETQGKVLTYEHCFSAFNGGSKNPSLTIRAAGRDPITIDGRFGYYLMAFTFDEKGTYYGTMKISESEFLKSQSCSKEARRAWPNVGGFAWKR